MQIRSISATQCVRVLFSLLTGFVMFSCAASSSDLEVTLGLSTAELIPSSVQSCTQRYAEVITPTATPTLDISSKWFSLKSPKLIWHPDDENLEIVAMTLTADTSNSCGMSFTCTLTPDEINFIFALPTSSKTASSSTVMGLELGYPSFASKLYGANTTENASCRASYGNGPILLSASKLISTDPDYATDLANTSSTRTANHCNYRIGNDVCKIRCGGVSATKAKCKAKAIMTVIGVKTNKSGDQFPVRATASVDVNNEFN